MLKKRFRAGRGLNTHTHSLSLTHSKFRHPNIMMLMGANVKPPDVFVVTEYCQVVTLFSLLHESKVTPPPCALHDTTLSSFPPKLRIVTSSRGLLLIISPPLSV